MLFHQGFDFQADQFVQPHFQDRRRLPLGKTKLCRLFFGSLAFKRDVSGLPFHKTRFRFFDIFAPAQNFDNQVNDVARPDQAFLNFFFLLFFAQQRPVFSGSNFILEIYMVANDGHKSHRFRFSVRNRKHIDAKRILQSCLFIE